jgi:hypothetical protein
MISGEVALKPKRRRWIESVPAILVVFLAILCGWHGASARILEVGAYRQLARPSAAAAIARDGDTIAIEPGRYNDCSIWSANHLTILGMREGVVITGEICNQKALFITKGDDITIRNITFTGAVGRWGNGAGIRAEGRKLTVEQSRFIDNEDAILAASVPQNVLIITNSTFIGNGRCRTGCPAHGVYAGNIALLRIIGSKFFATKIGHHIKSRAFRTELFDNDVEDGPDGTASFLVDVPVGSAFVMRHNVLEKGPGSGNPTAAIMIGEEGVTQPTPELLIDNNRFSNDQPRQTIFVHNFTATPAILTRNKLVGDIIPLSGAGSVR